MISMEMMLLMIMLRMTHDGDDDAVYNDYVDSDYDDYYADADYDYDDDVDVDLDDGDADYDDDDILDDNAENGISWGYDNDI